MLCPVTPSFSAAIFGSQLADADRAQLVNSAQNRGCPHIPPVLAYRRPFLMSACFSKTCPERRLYSFVFLQFPSCFINQFSWVYIIYAYHFIKQIISCLAALD